MRRRRTLTISAPAWLVAVACVVGVGAVAGLILSARSTPSLSPTPPELATTTTNSPGQRPGRGTGFGGDLGITFTGTASLAERRALLAACGSLPGVIAWTLTPDGGGLMTIPFDQEFGVTNAQKTKDQADRVRIYACVKASPLVTHTIEAE